MSEPISIIVTLFVLVVCAIFQPQRVQCPKGWYAAGVRPSGSFICVETSPISLCATRKSCGVTEQTPDVRVTAKIYCTGRSVPVVGNDGLTVGCQQPH